MVQTPELVYALKIFETIENFKPIINVGQFADKFDLSSRVSLISELGGMSNVVPVELAPGLGRWPEYSGGDQPRHHE